MAAARKPLYPGLARLLKGPAGASVCGRTPDAVLVVWRPAATLYRTEIHRL
jgi:hypothetical protein